MFLEIMTDSKKVKVRHYGANSIRLVILHLNSKMDAFYYNLTVLVGRFAVEEVIH